MKLKKLRLSARYAVVFVVIFAAIGSYLVWKSSAYFANEAHPLTAWTACNANANNGNPSTFAPMSDAAAAALVTHEPEIRSKNATGYTISGTHYPAPNYYVPSASEITSFRNATDQFGQTQVQENPYNLYVDGLDGMTNPSTDDLIQWGAHKWGIPEDWLRAEYVQESRWSQYWLGDRATETSQNYPLFPIQSRAPGSSTDVYESLGITQLKWQPGMTHPGTEPLRWKSTAFNIDYQAGAIRFYYDNPQGTRTSWGDASYVPCQQWNSLGGWFSPYPWNNSGQQSYISTVQGQLNNQAWTPSSFINESLPFPAAIVFDAATNNPPSTPTGLTSLSKTASSIALSWTASADTDSTPVAGYTIYRDGSLAGTSTTASYTDSGLSAGTTYSYTVSAYDTAALASGQSAALSVTTAAGGTGPAPGDCNSDGHVTVIDLSTLLSHYGQAYGACDFNSDGTIDVFDLSVLLSNYGK